jgi:hypothetical protein
MRKMSIIADIRALSERACRYGKVAGALLYDVHSGMVTCVHHIYHVIRSPKTMTE